MILVERIFLFVVMKIVYLTTQGINKTNISLRLGSETTTPSHWQKGSANSCAIVATSAITSGEQLQLAAIISKGNFEYKKIFTITFIDSLVVGNCGEVSFTEGAGRLSEPYEISNICQLQNIGATTDNLLSHYRLVSDIEAVWTKDWNQGLGFSTARES